ncbi:MAG: hypothetical protein DRI71_05410 [Bacteroidetes bacterium]|nr:MAG: hypothetical protein DRI71_05410 [Bacteroidota bacterium]
MGNVENLINNGEFELALSAINELMTEDEYNIDLLLLKAQVSSRLEQYEEVIDIYNRVINLMPGSAEYYAGRGLAYHAIGYQKQTLKDFTTAIELEPENGYRYASRAFIQDFLGKHLEALDDYNKAIELDPDDAVSLNNRGLVEEKLGRMHLSQKSFARADGLAGVDNQQHNPLLQPSNEASKQKTELSFKYFVDILKSLFTSASERKKFINFLLKR